MMTKAFFSYAARLSFKVNPATSSPETQLTKNEGKISFFLNRAKHTAHTCKPTVTETGFFSKFSIFWDKLYGPDPGSMKKEPKDLLLPWLAAGLVCAACSCSQDDKNRDLLQNFHFSLARATPMYFRKELATRNVFYSLLCHYWIQSLNQ